MLIFCWLLNTFWFIANKPTSGPAAAAAVTPATAGAATAAAVTPVVSKVEALVPQSTQKVEPLSDNEDSDVSGSQGDIQPVGHDYVEEVGEKWGEK